MPPEKTIIINNSKIAYYEQGKGETIILLHGWPQTSFVWRKIMPALSKKYRTIAVDLPGLGNSDRSDLNFFWIERKGCGYLCCET